MKSITTKLVMVISAIILVVVCAFLITATIRTNMMLNDDSQDILRSTADYYANIIDDNFRSTEQSVGTIFNYASMRAKTYTAFRTNEKELDDYTYDISELGKSIGENTRGAMAVYLRYNPDDFGPTSGFWYTINMENNSWESIVPTDMSLYEKDDLEHVGWYYVPVASGQPMWMEPYYNANINVNMISYIVPFFYDGYTVGIIGMDINMDFLKDAVAKVSVYDSGHAFLIDKNGNVMYHEAYPGGIVFADLPQNDQLYFSKILNLKMDEPVVFESMDGIKQKVILKELKNGMLLGIYAPLSEINTPQHTLLYHMAFISAIILLMAVLFILIWVNTQTKPIKKMTNVAEHYAKGDFSEKISVQSQDEIGILSRSLQTMSTSLQEQIRLADSANKAKSDFLANMSHEIRTPINAILGMNEMILHETEEKEVLECSDNIRTAGNTLLSLVNTILDFSKIEDGKMEIIPVNYSTVSMINNLVNSIMERTKDKGLKLELDIDENLPSTLWGDDIRISQVIMNLLTNAVKYTEKGEITFTIRGQERVNDKCKLFISVKDTGIGIREEDIGKLFESFERIEEKRNRNIEGTGLGISIVNRLLDMMDSELKVNSVYGEGSEFSFMLIQKIVDERPIGNYVDRLHRSPGKAKRKVSLKVTGARVLVVDDNEMNLKVARNLMNLCGIMPDLAVSGAEAIEMIKKNNYNIVFLDHMMPKMDGIETLNELKKQNLLRGDTTVVSLTANAIVGAREYYLDAGFDDYLSKPIELKKLEDMLVKYLPKDSYEYVESDEVSDKSKSKKVTGRQDNAHVNTKDNTQVNAQEEYGSDNGDVISRLAQNGINTSAGLKYTSEDEDFYCEILMDFATKQEEKAADILSDYEKNDIHDYGIKVHALKSVAKTIGADELSAMALEQEMAAKSDNTEAIENGYQALLETYAKVAKLIKEVVGGEDQNPSGLSVENGSDNDGDSSSSISDSSDNEIDISDLSWKLSEVSLLLKTSEVTEAEDRLKEIEAYTYKGTPLKVHFKDIMAALDDFDTEEAMKHLTKLRDSMDKE